MIGEVAHGALTVLLAMSGQVEEAKYDQLIAVGKEKKVAITAVMRKLLVLANALLRDHRKWTESAA